MLAGSGVNAENIQSELQSIKFYQNNEPAEIMTFEIDIDVSMNYMTVVSELLTNVELFEGNERRQHHFIY